MDYFYVELYNAESDKTINLSIDNYELDENMAFSFYYDASWDSGKYIPRYASLSDEAGNYVSAYSDDDKLTDKVIADFKKSTGIDLSSNTFNLSVSNSKADTSPPVISDLSITGENLSLLNGIKTLSVIPGQDSSVKIQELLAINQPVLTHYGLNFWKKIVSPRFPALLTRMKLIPVVTLKLFSTLST